MKIFNLRKTFAQDESGAVTVDWVVLTAAVVGLTLLVLPLVQAGLETAGADIVDGIEQATEVGDG